MQKALTDPTPSDQIDIWQTASAHTNAEDKKEQWNNYTLPPT
jgi:hypothetical protein